MNRVYALIALLTLATVGLKAQTYFPPIQGGEWDTVSFDELSWCEEAADTLLSFLEDRNTRSFIILVDGKIAIEAYLNGHSENSLWYWASAGKTLAATLAGIAQEEGSLNIDDPVSQYLGEGWADCTSEEEAQRTIWHQLTMTSTFDNSFLLADCTEPECFQCDGEAGSEWHYHNGVYRRLHDVIESATGDNMNAYTGSRIEDKIGMTGFWTNEQLYISRARDMARFGLLALNDFVWDGDVVLGDQDYIEEMTTPSQSLNQSYGYLWWLNGQESHMLPQNPNVLDGMLIPTAPDDLYAGLGANDQKVYVVPSMNMVVVRMGESAAEAAPSLTQFDTNLWELIMALPCTINSTDNPSDTGLELLVYPNPSQGEVYIKNVHLFKSISVYDLVGRLVGTYDADQVESGISLSRGAYIISGITQNGVPKAARALVE